MTTPTWTGADVAAIARFVAERTGLAFPAGRIAAVDAEIRRTAARSGFADVAAYHEALATEAVPLDDLVTGLTIGETYFFRDPAQLEIVRRELIPEIRRRRGDDHVARVWSAGCASGEEAYSLAILCKEAGLASHVRILATDISAGALVKARRGVYGRWSLRGDGEVRTAPYLAPVADGFAIDDRIRQMVTFGRLNLARGAHPAVGLGIWGMDLVLCRNVLIYFDPAAIRRAARHLFASMADGGWLVTGPSDPPLADAAPFEMQTTDAGVIYRRPLASAVTVFPVARGPGPAAIAATIAEPGPDERAPTAAPASDVMTTAQAAFDTGDHATVVAVTRAAGHDPAACGLAVRALANLDPAAADAASAAAVARHPLSVELHYLRALLCLGLGREDAALAGLRRVLYLDRSLAAAHFTLAAALERTGDREGAWRAYRNARDLCAGRPADEVVALAEGACAGELVRAAAAEMGRLDPGASAAATELGSP